MRAAELESFIAAAAAKHVSLTAAEISASGTADETTMMAPATGCLHRRVVSSVIRLWRQAASQSGWDVKRLRLPWQPPYTKLSHSPVSSL
jgi:hypothetical protein